MKDKVDSLNEQAKKYEEEIKSLNIKRINLKKHAMKICSHDLVLEAPFREDTLTESYFGGPHHDPPFRVCKKCGYAEEGWGCGYNKLEDKNGRDIIEVTSREKAQKYVEHMRCQR